MNKQNTNQSFSSFADLKNLQQQLREKEAQEAQQKAEAIIVSQEQEQSNPLKQKAKTLLQNLNTLEQQNKGNTQNLNLKQQEQATKSPKLDKVKSSRYTDKNKKLDRALERLEAKSKSFNNLKAKDKQSNTSQEQNVNNKAKVVKKPAQNKAKKVDKNTQSNVLKLKQRAFDTTLQQKLKDSFDKVSYQAARLLSMNFNDFNALVFKTANTLYSQFLQSQRLEQSNDSQVDFGGIEDLALFTKDLNQVSQADLDKIQKHFIDLALKSVAVTKAYQDLNDNIDFEVLKLQDRVNNVPNIEYAEDLPVSQRSEEIIKAISENQVVIIAGETGSGKTTQIPKMCLQAGFGIKGLIGHTQPRRIAARAVASRIAQELHEDLGKSVSYKVRFTDISSEKSYIKLMTDGILLAELSTDRLLLNYDVIIIDEAHERSLNIDFLLGYLKNLLTKRPELKLIITSATIDVERFSEHFNHAPIIEVSGRTYPVEVVYMPLADDGKGVYIEQADGKGYYVNQGKHHIDEQSFDDRYVTQGPFTQHGTKVSSNTSISSQDSQDINAYRIGDYGSQAHRDSIAKEQESTVNEIASDSVNNNGVDSAIFNPFKNGAYQASLAKKEQEKAENSISIYDSIRASLSANKTNSVNLSKLQNATSKAPKVPESSKFKSALNTNRVKAQKDTSVEEDHSFDSLDLQQGILEAIHYLESRGRGDILIFLPGERDILELSQFLRRAQLRDTEIVPLYARLATSEQNKIFTEHTGMRIVLATNVAETSLTVPGIKYVIDPGLARISRYSSRTKVQRLPIEPISQASANQRKGRCGRVSNGICVRLYSKSDFDNRPEFTDPEILRTNLASVLLQMASLRLGNIENFPFIDAPAPRQISDGLRLLDELGATQVNKGNQGDLGRNNKSDNLELTKVGKALAKLPCDPRLARMILEADKYHSLTEVLIIVSALAVMDPREYPLDRKEAASNSHKRFNDEKSDFISFLKLYDYIIDLQSKLSNSALRKQLKQEFISFLRVREWFDVHRQLRVSAQMLGLKRNEVPADYESIHRSLVAGLLSHLGMLEQNGNNYIGARGSKFVIFPGSALARKPPKWICASELSETSRLFARTVAYIEPNYAENAGQHLIKNTYNEPHWSKKNGAVMAYLTKSIYGLPIVQRRLCQYKDIDPNFCHEMFIAEGLVGGNIECNHRFFKYNLSLIEDVEYLEDKVRRRDLLVDSHTLQDFYAQRIPESINNMVDFDKWWRKKSKEDPNYLDFSYELISKNDILAIDEQQYPEYWHQGDLRFKLSYVFDIGSPRDGVTVHIPITVINQVRSDEFLWQIDGLRRELFASMIKSLPKRLRRNLIPAPDYAKALDESLSPYVNYVNHHGLPEYERKALVAKYNQGKVKLNLAENFFVVVARELTRMGGELISVDDFERTLIEPYLFMNFLIEDINGNEIAYGKNFIVLAERLQGKAREVLHQVVKQHQVKAPAQDWEYGTIKQEQVTKQGSLNITAYPALTDRGDGVTLELYDSKERQEKAMRKGVIKLIALSLKSPTSYLETHLPNRAKLSMYYQPLGSVKDLIFDLMLCSISNIMDRNGGIPWTEDNFKQIREKVRGELNDEALSVAKIIETILVKAHELKRLLKGSISFDLARSYADLNEQLDNLVYKGFVSDCGMEHLVELPRYLQAALERISRIHRDVVRDQMYLRALDQIKDEYEKSLKRYHQDLIPKPLKDVKWMIEELRVSYFAQNLGVNGPISDKRIFAELEHILKEYPPHK